jgi:hypothetical protein
MLEKSPVFMMLLIVTASLVGISTLYQPTSVTTQPQRSIGPLFGQVENNVIYAHSDGKACLGLVKIIGPEPFPLGGLKRGNTIHLLTLDGSICDSLSQASVAKQNILFYVAPAPVTANAIPPVLREAVQAQTYYRVILIIVPSP